MMMMMMPERRACRDNCQLLQRSADFESMPCAYRILATTTFLTNGCSHIDNHTHVVLVCDDG